MAVGDGCTARAMVSMSVARFGHSCREGVSFTATKNNW